jgi:hypothetical protein
MSILFNILFRKIKINCAECKKKIACKNLFFSTKAVDLNDFYLIERKN